jgi:PII-like signaling protein
MKGFLVTFFTKQDERHGHAHLHEWLMRSAQAMGIEGSTAVMAAEGYGHHGRRHSMHFFELADQPLEVQMAMTEDQARRFFALLAQEGVEVFYVKAEVEFGRTPGAPAR